MAELTASDLASRLGVSRARISQYVSEGKLAGCYRGEGRARRFDLAACANALGRRLDSAQMLGNGATTRRKLAQIAARPDVAEPRPQAPGDRAVPQDGRQLPTGDPDRYELARTLKAEEEARRLRRQNLAEEGIWVLASEVELRVARLMAQEIAAVETMLRDAAQAVADELGIEAPVVRHALVQSWRRHRSGRAEALAAEAETATLTPAEIAAEH